MYWTFDPLESRNACLNLNRLGARVERYEVDMYGTEPTALTDTVIGTDRFVVRWDLEASSGDIPTDVMDSNAPIVTASLGSSGPNRREPDLITVPEVRVEIPHDIQQLKSLDPDVAAAWRQTTRRALTHYLDSGYRVKRVEPVTPTRRVFYLLGTSE